MVCRLAAGRTVRIVVFWTTDHLVNGRPDRKELRPYGNTNRSTPRVRVYPAIYDRRNSFRLDRRCLPTQAHHFLRHDRVVAELHCLRPRHLISMAFLGAHGRGHRRGDIDSRRLLFSERCVSTPPPGERARHLLVRSDLWCGAVFRAGWISAGFLRSLAWSPNTPGTLGALAGRLRAGRDSRLGREFLSPHTTRAPSSD